MYCFRFCFHLDFSLSIQRFVTKWYQRLDDNSVQYLQPQFRSRLTVKLEGFIEFINVYTQMERKNQEEFMKGTLEIPSSCLLDVKHCKGP